MHPQDEDGCELCGQGRSRGSRGAGARIVRPVVRILLMILHPGVIRLFDGLVRELDSRGHELHLGFETVRDHQVKVPAAELVAELERERRVTSGPLATRTDEWAPLARELRTAVDYLRYLEPEYDGAAKLRKRAARGMPAGVAERMSELGPPEREALGRELRALEVALPVPEAVTAHLRELAPDLVVATTLVTGDNQTDYIRAAQALRCPTALCVASWDNLTNKGMIQAVPDRLYVWNELQVRELVDMHSVPEERAVACGAHSFDDWFERGPSTSPEEFRARRGLPAERPILLYACSSKFVGRDEPDFVDEWVRRIRAAPDRAVREAGVLIRPHPKSGVRFADTTLGELDGVTVWPPTGALNVTEETRRGYFDSIHHAAAMVGLNTSALVEATIVDTPVFTLTGHGFRSAQEDTLHFRYLLEENGGPLTRAASFEEHLEQLARRLGGSDAAAERRHTFAGAFLRPRGRSLAATPLLADELEAQTLRGPQPVLEDALGNGTDLADVEASARALLQGC